MPVVNLKDNTRYRLRNGNVVTMRTLSHSSPYYVVGYKFVATKTGTGEIYYHHNGFICPPGLGPSDYDAVEELPLQPKYDIGVVAEVGDIVMFRPNLTTNEFKLGTVSSIDSTDAVSVTDEKDKYGSKYRYIPINDCYLLSKQYTSYGAMAYAEQRYTLRMTERELVKQKEITSALAEYISDLTSALADHAAPAHTLCASTVIMQLKCILAGDG